MGEEALIVRKISAPPPTERVVADYLPLSLIIPMLLANAGAERGSANKRRSRRSRPKPTQTNFHVGVVYFLDACQGATHLLVWLACRNLYPSGVSDTEAVITAAGKEKHVVAHEYYQSFLVELAELSRIQKVIKFMLHGTECLARIQIISPCNDHCATVTQLGYLGGPSDERSFCDAADAAVFGVMSDQGSVDVTMGALEEMRSKLRERVTEAAAEYRERLILGFEQPCQNTHSYGS
jgi:hypothetical protein